MSGPEAKPILWDYFLTNQDFKHLQGRKEQVTSALKKAPGGVVKNPELMCRDFLAITEVQVSKASRGG